MMNQIKKKQKKIKNFIINNNNQNINIIIFNDKLKFLIYIIYKYKQIYK